MTHRTLIDTHDRSASRTRDRCARTSYLRYQAARRIIPPSYPETRAERSAGLQKPRPAPNLETLSRRGAVHAIEYAFALGAQCNYAPPAAGSPGLARASERARKH